MTDQEKVIKALECCKTENCSECPYMDTSAPIGKFGTDELVACQPVLYADAITLLKAQEPRVLQIKEMALLEIAVFIETNGDLEGKGTDLFLAIQYIYAVSQNMLGGYIAFVDGNTDVYDLQAIDYGKLWRCWTSRPTDEQREATQWGK